MPENKTPGVRCPVIPVSNNEMIKDTMLEVFNPVKTASNTKVEKGPVQFPVMPLHNFKGKGQNARREVWCPVMPATCTKERGPNACGAVPCDACHLY